MGGDVLAGRVEQGVVKPGEEVVFLPTHTASNPCVGKVFTAEMHHMRVDFANPGDNVGLNIKGLDKQNMPRSGDVMVYKKDTTLGQTREFDAQIQVLDIPNEIKTGYSPIGFVTIACTTKEFYTEKWHYAIIDAPGHRDFIKNMITGASQADCALVMVPADGNFTTAIAKGNHKAGEIQGQTRQHARLINLLGVKQICCGINKMDCDVAGYKQSRYDEIMNEMKSTLVKVGWKKDAIEKNTQVLPISGWMGDNLLKKSTNMTWWTGMDVLYEGKEKLHVDTLFDVLDKYCRVPERPVSAPMRMPVSGIYKIKGVGDVLAGRVEQGVVKPGEEVVFLPTHT